MSDLTGYKVKFLLESMDAVPGQLIRFLAPRTVDTIAKSLPLEGRAAVWREEVYFETRLRLGPEKARSDVPPGSIAYWPMGAAVCVFFGKTKPYGPVNMIGKIAEKLELFRSVKPGTKITLVRD